MRPPEPAVDAGERCDDAGMRLSPLDGLAGLTLVGLVFLLSTFPATWLLMLFLGNVGIGTSYFGTLPLGAVVSWLIGTSSSGLRTRI